jgi:hypothetical protein
MSMAAPLGGAARESESTHHQQLGTSVAGPWVGADRELGAPTINAKKHRW